ncbi:Streptococcus pyogenes, putative [Babesia ovis]|uniref:Streptococcus pyogenes, putative n=1 Tax=Babesia ovis TaxID=5869 RepID=A0A9W5WUU3_BABOV|nr:Streptococcus pyogenes, putative [Babesia ovis]
MEALNYIYSDKSFMEPPLADATGKHVRELIFSPLNRQLVTEVSPSMRSQPLEALTGSIEQALHRFAVYNTRAKEYVCINGLFHAVGAKEFGKTLRVLRLQHKLGENVDSQTLNDYFMVKLAEASDLARLEAVDMTLLLLHHQGTDDIFRPFVQGSWRPVDILQHILQVESKMALQHFFAEAPSQVQSQACELIKTKDCQTGLLKYPWAYVELQRNLVKHIVDGSQNIVVGIAPGNSRIHMEQQRPGSGIVNTTIDTDIASVVDTIADVNHVLKVLKHCAHHCTNGQKGLVAVHIERDAAAICTANHSFIVDLLVTDPYYQTTLFDLLAWLWSNSALLKVGYNLLQKVAKVASEFDRPFTAFTNMIDLRNQRVKEEYGDNGEQAVVRFKPAGLSRNLRGLMQEFYIPVFPTDKMWNAQQRPICPSRVKCMENIARGMLSIEQKLRDDGWFPTDCCDLESYENDRICEELEQRIRDALL